MLSTCVSSESLKLRAYHLNARCTAILSVDEMYGLWLCLHSHSMAPSSLSRRTSCLRWGIPGSSNQRARASAYPCIVWVWVCTAFPSVDELFHVLLPGDFRALRIMTVQVCIQRRCSGNCTYTFTCYKTTARSNKTKAERQMARH